MNVEFSPTICEKYINSLRDESDFLILRQAAKDLGVPSLEESACSALTNIVSIKKPENSIDIGCGIGVSSLSILKGYEKTKLVAIDGNLERSLFFMNYFKEYSNITHYQMRGEQYLKTTEKMFDLAFVDSVKREYSSIWRLLRKRLNSGAVVVFDDILIYGYIMCEESETPYKYRTNRRETINFINEVFSDDSLSCQIVPVSGGLLVISLKD